MADLNGSRGQILLIAAFTLAVLFIGLALVVNGAIFTQNLASQGDTSGGGDLLQQRAEVNRTLGAALDDLNENGPDDYPILRSEFEVQILPKYTRNLRRYTLLNGRSTTLTFQSKDNGLYIEDEATGSNDFTAEDGAADWLIGSNFDGVRSLQFFIRRPINEISSDPYNISLEGQFGETYHLRIGHSGGVDEYPTLEVEASNFGGASGTCTLDGRDFPVRLDVTAARFGGEYCAPLDNIDMGEYVSVPATIRVRNGNNIHGNYSMVLQAPGSGPLATGNFGTDPADPTWKRALYAAVVRLGVRAENIRFSEDVTIAPGVGL